MVKNKLNLSFTLIELLITVTIIFIFSGLSLAYYNNFTQEQQLKNEAKKFVDVLELAKKKALVGDYGDSNFLYGYRVITSTSYYRLVRCQNINCSPYQEIKTFNIPSNISFLNTYYIHFLPLTAKVNSNAPSFPVSIQIRMSSINKCITVETTQFGIINLGETLISC